MEVTKITSVRYGKTFNLGNYENERLDAYAAVEEGQDAAEALAQAKAFVEAQHQETRRGQQELEAADRLESRVGNAKYQLRYFERTRKEFVEKLSSAAKILAAHGITVEIPEHLLEPFEVEDPAPMSQEEYESLRMDDDGEDDDEDENGDDDQEF